MSSLHNSVDALSSSPGTSASDDRSDLVVNALLLGKISASDLELTEEQQAVNKQAQEDEILALQSIFDDEFIHLGESLGSSQKFMVSIHVELPSDLSVSVKLYNDATQTTAWVHTCTLQFLPPLQLVFEYPISYPSHSPPVFILSARWLTATMLSSLCECLDSLWEQQVGEVLVYAWAEWLRTSCFSHLGITNELELDTLESKIPDKRVLSWFSCLDVDIPLLIRYNEEKKDIEFSKGLHTCLICFMEQPGKSFVKFPCRHFFCVACIEQYLRISIEEGAVKKLNCPDTSCQSSIPPVILKQVIGEENFNRWDSLLLQRTLNAMGDIVYCPRCNTACIEDKDHHAQCSNCLFSFCSLCCAPRHVGQECMPAEVRLKILQERQESGSGRQWRNQELNLRNELLNMRYLNAETKKCPYCKMAITKSEGCNKMTCGNCGQYFCYICGKGIKGYEHFRDGCVLFDEAVLQQWEQQWQQAPRPPRVAGGDGIWCPCPNCRQQNLKEGNNNHLFCSSCQQHYCFLCRKVVRRSAEHFGSGANKCRQHTRD